MSKCSAVLMITALLFGTAFVAAGSAGASTPTDRVVVRPVTATGHAAAGYKVVKEPDDPVFCNYPEPSVAAVNKNILFCSPSAAYAVACWRSATPHHVLCLRDARKKTLAKLPTVGKIAHAKPLKIKSPLDVRLRNGAYCTFRAGGAGPTLKDHPNWAVSYYCTKGLSIWTRMDSPRLGIKRAHPVWRAYVARTDGQGPLTLRRIKRVWFVGTKH